MNKPPSMDRINAFVLLSRAKGHLQRKQFQQALDDLSEAVRLCPQSGEALMVRAAVYVEMAEYQQAMADVERCLQIEPPDPLALLTRGNLRAHLGEFEAALVDFTEYLRQQPATQVALRARSLSYARLLRFDEALADLNEALRIGPDCADAYLERGRIHQNKGCYAAALADYQKALELGPNEPYTCNQYAWVLAACPQPEHRNGARAVELARRGCESTNWEDANIIDTLASAYAECGQFDEAVRWATKSLELAGGEIKEAVSRHVQLFRNGQPARFEENSAP